MHILKLLSEEVFEVRDQMTTSKTKTLKERLNEEFAQIFNLCDMVLQQSQKPSLLNVTLQTLQRFLTWVKSLLLSSFSFFFATFVLFLIGAVLSPCSSQILSSQVLFIQCYVCVCVYICFSLSFFLDRFLWATFSRHPSSLCSSQSSFQFLSFEMQPLSV
jgi:hypothetical protein